jgi:hypothetical protein
MYCREGAGNVAIVRGDCIVSMLSGFSLPFTFNFMSYNCAYSLFPEVMSKYDEVVQVPGPAGPVAGFQRRLWERFRSSPEYSEVRYIGDAFTKCVRFTEDDESDDVVGPVGFKILDGVVTSC